MGLLDESLQQYYQGNDFGNYQINGIIRQHYAARLLPRK